MSYAFGNLSKAKLIGVHPVMVRVATRAIAISEQDFGVYEGVRSLDRQRKLLASGASKTLKSMHIPQPDLITNAGEILGHALDLVPWIDGQFRWEWGPCYLIASAVSQAARELEVADKLCWGGCWGRPMSAYGTTPAAMKAAVAEYQARHPGPDFIDGPHFQIGRLS